MPPAGQSSSGRIIDDFDHGWSRNGRARYRGSQNLVIRVRKRMEGLLAAMPPAGQSSSGRIIDDFDHGWSRNGRARYRGSQNLVIRVRRRMEGLRRSGGDLGREG